MPRQIEVYSVATTADLNFMMNSGDTGLPSLSSTGSSTRSDAQSASPDLDLLWDQLCGEYHRCVHEAGRVLPPEWTMPDLVRAIFGDQAIEQGFLTDAYYDVMLCGTHSWGCEELLNFLDLIHYVF
jgi:hypothetical protein